MGGMSRTALIQVLGAVAYGELKAHEGLVAVAEETADELRHLLATESDGRQRARGAARSMTAHMLASGAGPAGPRFAAFVQIGKPVELVLRITGGFARRLAAIGVAPVSVALP